MNGIVALFAFAVFTVFVGILAIKVPSPDLVVVILLTVALVGYDFITTIIRKRD